jgi:hypothetical protein
MKARDIPKDAFPIESDDPSVPLIWCGHVSIVFERKKKEEEHGAGTEEAAQGS